MQSVHLIGSVCFYHWFYEVSVDRMFTQRGFRYSIAFSLIPLKSEHF